MQRDQDANSGRLRGEPYLEDGYYKGKLVVYVPELCRYVHIDLHAWKKSECFSLQAHHVQVVDDAPTRPINVTSGSNIWKKILRDGGYQVYDMNDFRNYGMVSENRIGTDWLVQEGFIEYMDEKHKTFRKKPGLQPGLNPPGYLDPKEAVNEALEPSLSLEPPPNDLPAVPTAPASRPWRK